MLHFDEKFWLAIAFFTFLGLVIRFAWPIIRKSLDDNSKKIAQEILAAKEMKENAEKLLSKAEIIYKEAVLFSEKLVKDTQEEVKQLTAEAQKLLDDEVAKRKATALSRIKNEEESAIRELKTKIVNSALGKLANELSLDQSGHDKVIEKALNNFGKTVH
jgi:F-type H+-transporting ATPase subunit b